MTHRPPALMLLGTHSSAGKSLLTTAFCRILARRGLRVAPFKAQNMSNNAGVTPEGGEMGRSQIVQAEAAGIPPHTDMNPVLLKPEANRRSQVILNGRIHGHIEARNWYELKATLWDAVQAAYDRLAARVDVVILEGAGSPAEINLKQGDIVNLRMAAHAGAPCLLVGDIDRGGVFAALAGTLLLLEPEERQQIRGFLINKFRGDPALLGNATEMLRRKAFGVPTLGIVPYLDDLDVPDEDAVALDELSAQPVSMKGGDAPGHAFVEIAIIRLPHVANFDEFAVLAAEPGVTVRYVQHAHELDKPRVVILPGTKATLADLAWLRDRALDRAIVAAHADGVQIAGICGGYQLLGQALHDPEGVESAPGAAEAGLGLLPLETNFCAEKQTHQSTLRLPDGSTVTGYEIHMGETTPAGDVEPWGEIVVRNGQAIRVPDGARAADGSVWGTYLHGLFENDDFRAQWLHSLGWRGTVQATRARRAAAYDRLAGAVEAAVEWPAVEQLLGLA